MQRGAGAFLLALSLAGCDLSPPPPLPALIIAGDTIALAPGARIVEIEVRVRESGSEFAPDTVRAATGDVLRFVTGDGRGHALAFDVGAEADTASTFLDATGQRRSPPLLITGAVWLVDLREAPTGQFRVLCVTHDTSVHLEVSAR